MEYSEVVARRRMSRSFESCPVDSEVLDGLLRQALRAPSAGNTASLRFLVLEGAEQTGSYWDVTLPPVRRVDFAWPRLLDAPVLVVPWVDPDAYVSRYAEPDKVCTGLGRTPADWPVPYWFVDGGAAVMSLLYGAVDAGLGALFFGLFGHEDAVRSRFGVPPGQRAVGTIALGHPVVERLSASARRPRLSFDEVIHRGRW